MATPTLYDIYNRQGKQLPTTVDARFADPAFAKAAQSVGITKDAYAINAGNAAMNNKIAQAYNTAPATSTPVAPVTPATAPATSGTNPGTGTGETLAQIQARVANQGKPGYDVFGNPVDGTAKASAIIGSSKYGSISPEDIAYNSLNVNPTYPTLTPEQEANIRSQQLQMHQAEIDAANKYYDDLVSKSILEGQGYLGSMSARQARSGLLGSDFGAAQEAKTIAFNDSNIKSINNERNNKIASIYAQGRSDATAEIKAQRDAAKQGYDTYIAYLNGKQERQANGASRAAAALLAAGVDVTDPSQKDVLDETAKAYQLDSSLILSAVKDAKTAAEKAKLANDLTKAQITDTLAKNKFQTLADGAQLYDDKGNLIAENNKNFKPGSGGGSGGAGGMSALSQAVAANPTLFSTLTPTQKGLVITQLGSSGFDTTQLTIPAVGPTERQKLDDYDTLTRETDSADTILAGGSIKTGPIQGFVDQGQNLLGYNKDFSNYNSSISNLSSILLRARSGGAVTPQEYDRIVGFIPTKFDNTEIAKTKIARFKSELAAAKANYITRITQTPLDIRNSGQAPTAGNAINPLGI